MGSIQFRSIDWIGTVGRLWDGHLVVWTGVALRFGVFNAKRKEYYKPCISAEFLRNVSLCWIANVTWSMHHIFFFMSEKKKEIALWNNFEKCSPFDGLVVFNFVSGIESRGFSEFEIRAKGTADSWLEECLSVERNLMDSIDTPLLGLPAS